MHFWPHHLWCIFRGTMNMGSVASFSVFLLVCLASNHFVGVKGELCAREWLKYQGNCYGYFETKLTWQEAEIECQSYQRGTHLASLLTPAESLVVADHISAYQYKISDVWIGLHDIRHNGQWRWTDESTYNYKAWMEGAPNNLGQNQYCVELPYSVHGRIHRNGTATPSGQEHRPKCDSEERNRNEHEEFTKWNDAVCHKVNAYICKHEL